MRSLARLVAFILLTPALALGQKNCKKGIPCGGTCIAANKVCHVGAPSPAPAAAPSPATAATMTEASASVWADNTSPWVASRVGRTYYLAGCRAANKLKPENRQFYKTEEQAKAAGLTRSRSKGC